MEDTNMNDLIEYEKCLYFSQKIHRKKSFDNINLSIFTGPSIDMLCKFGFFYDKIDNKVKCFCCNYDYFHTIDNDNIIAHNCTFINNINNNGNESEEILTRDSIYYSLNSEKERRKTFYEWPIPHIISPNELAKNGFYYMKIKDHTACIFCNQIIGHWKIGDTVYGEHKRLSPHCLYLNNHPVSNITLSQSEILEKLPLDGEEYPLMTLDYMYSSHVYINRNNFDIDKAKKYGHFPPKILKYRYYEDRLKTFKNWPERTGQTKTQMCIAGFFYYGK